MPRRDGLNAPTAFPKSVMKGMFIKELEKELRWCWAFEEHAYLTNWLMDRIHMLKANQLLTGVPYDRRRTLPE